MMLLANYQFSDFFGATLRYSHMDFESMESDRVTFAFLFTITENFDINLEYSHTDNDGADEIICGGRDPFIAVYKYDKMNKKFIFKYYAHKNSAFILNTYLYL